MKKAIVILIISILATPDAMAQQEIISAFLEKWENSKKYLIAIAEAMPEEHYMYKPTEKQMSFAAQLIHIQGNINWLGNTYFSSEKVRNSEKTNEKQQQLDNIAAAFDAVYNAIKDLSEKELSNKVDFFAGPKTKLQILNLLQDHVSHHRGQLIVYLNLNNIKPPRYVGW